MANKAKSVATVSFTRFVDRRDCEPGKKGWQVLAYFDVQVDTPFGPMIIKDCSVIKNVKGDGTVFIGYPQGAERQGKRWNQVLFTNALDKAKFEKAVFTHFDEVVATLS
jgi:hypothetical protein